jgi:hypothetical protein
VVVAHKMIQVQVGLEVLAAVAMLVAVREVVLLVLSILVAVVVVLV